MSTTDRLRHWVLGEFDDSDALLKATAGQAGEKVEHARGRAEESLRAARARLPGYQPYALGNPRCAQ